MTPFEWATVGLSCMSLIGIPMLALLIRLTIRFTRLTDRLDDLVADVDRAHQELYRTMRDDRAVTDRRLRWIEERMWRPFGSRRG